MSLSMVMNSIEPPSLGSAPVSVSSEICTSSSSESKPRQTMTPGALQRASKPALGSGPPVPVDDDAAPAAPAPLVEGVPPLELEPAAPTPALSAAASLEAPSPSEPPHA